MKNSPEHYRRYFLRTGETIDFLTGGSCSKFYRIRNLAEVKPRKKRGRKGRWYGPKEVVKMAQRHSPMELFDIWCRMSDHSGRELPKLAYSQKEVCEHLVISEPSLRKYRKLLGISPRRRSGSRKYYYLYYEVLKIADLAYPHVDKYTRSPEDRVEEL